MPRNGSGTYAAPSLPGSFNPAVTGQAAIPTDWNTLLADFSTTFTQSIATDGQSVISQNIPFNTKRITGLGDPVDPQDAATKNYVLANPPGYLFALTLSRSSATVLGIAAGFCLDSTNAFGIMLSSAFTKSVAGTWVSGTGSNGMGTGLTIANNTWYHVFAIINGGVADVYFDTSVTAANKPASTTAFRRLGSFRTDGSAQIIAFTQVGDEFIWSATVAAFSGNFSTSPNTITAVVPTGVIVQAKVRALSSSGTGGGIILYSPAQAAQVLNVPTGNFSLTWTGNAQSAGDFTVRTNTSGQFQGVGTASGENVFIVTYGWNDTRGRNS